MKDLKKVTHQHLSSLDRRKVWESTAEDSVDQSLGASISNETCESTLSALANELKVFDNTGLNNSGGVAKIRKKWYFIIGFQKKGEWGKSRFISCTMLTFC